MTQTLRIALGQLNPIVGDIAGNVALIRSAYADAAGADLLVLPELVISGYPPEDLLLRPAYVESCMTAVRTLAAETTSGGPGIVLTCPWVSPSEKLAGDPPALQCGRVVGRRRGTSRSVQTAPAGLWRLR